jgi:hypothetical protein
MARPCGHTKPDGTPCKAAALAGSDRCFWHAKDRQKDRKAASRRGGQAAHRKTAVLPADAPDAPLSTVADVVALLGETVHQVRTGAVDVRVGNCVGLLAGQLLRALTPTDLARDLAELRAMVEGERRDRPADDPAPGGGPARAAAAAEAGGRAPAGAPDVGPLAV